MERFVSLYNQYEAKRIETSALGSQILGDENLFKQIARELAPELFEKQANDKERYTYLNKLIDKYQHNSAIPKLPGAQFGGAHQTASLIGAGLIEHANEKLYKAVRKVLDKRRAQRNALKKLRKQNKK